MVALFFEGLKWYFYFSSNRARWVSLGYFFYWTERLTSFWETLYQSSGRSCSYRELFTLCRWEASVHSTASELFQSRSCVVGRIIGRMPGTLLWLLSGIKSLTFFFKLPSCSHRADFWKKKSIFFFKVKTKTIYQYGVEMLFRMSCGQGLDTVSEKKKHSSIRALSESQYYITDVK